MTQKEFREKWAADQITWDDIADCAKDWGIFQKPRCAPLNNVRYLVLTAADIPNAEEYHPNYLESIEAEKYY